jgi:hypothetical protein
MAVLGSLHTSQIWVLRQPIPQLLCSALLSSPLFSSTLVYSALLYSTLLYSTLLYSTLLHHAYHIVPKSLPKRTPKTKC